MAEIKITLVKSTIGAIPKHKRTVQALGLNKTNRLATLLKLKKFDFRRCPNELMRTETR